MPLAAAIPAIIGGVSSVAGGLIGAHGASTAAAQQVAAAQQGIKVAGQNLQSAVGGQTAATQQQQGLYSPYLQAGQQGLGNLASMLSTPGQGLLQGWNQSFQAPTAEQAAATPGYQFTMQQGLNAIQNSAAAKGNLLSGGTQKALAGYASGLASTNYQQTYNNAFQNYLQNYNQFQTNQANNYSRLLGLTGIGTGATGQLAGLSQSGAQNLGNIYNANTDAMSRLLGTQGAAQASGTMGQAAAYGNMFSNLASAGQQGYYDVTGNRPSLQTPYANLGSPSYMPTTYPDITAPTGTYGVTGVAPGTGGGNQFGGLPTSSFPTSIYAGAASGAVPMSNYLTPPSTGWSPYQSYVGGNI